MQSINTALCSFGMSGRLFHAPFIHLNPGYNLYSVFERTKNLAHAIYPGIKTFRSLEAMLEDDAIELLVVNTPNYSHYNYARLGLEAGKHVVIEKPFTLNVKEAEILIELSKARNKQLTVYHNRRWDSDYKTVKNIVNKKLLGNIVDVEIHLDRFKEDLSPKLHKEVPGSGNGILYDLGSHLIDQAIQLFGMPNKIFADLNIIRPFSVIEDYMNIILFYPDLRVTIKGSYIVKEPLPSYILHGSCGSFIKPRADIQEAELQNGKSPSADNWGIEPEDGKGLLHNNINGISSREYIPSLKGNYMEYYDLLYKAIRGNSPLPVTAGEGLLVIKIIEMAYQSVSEKRIIEI